MKPTTQNPELISALADGQLAGEDLAAALALCETDGQARTSWGAYHLIGDVLRSPGLVPQASDDAFVMRLRARLVLEPVLAAVPGSTVLAQGSVVTVPERQAANDARFSWKLVAGFASLVAVVAVGWNAGSGLLSPSAAPQLARSEPSPQQVLVMSAQGPVVRDARLQELLAEHKQFGGLSALQMPSGFLRNATFDATQGERR
ncbi:sigma-E factor negative regulatory protein [Polaromonas sp.]|uniref:sigma-E factor negative regulatory protein n=1 Tax=Polaromonas sp. TaxID=1869339 RepID=UPI00374FDEF2